MARKVSAGVLLYRRAGDRLEVLIAHPGGPFWAKKDEGAWTIPKGLVGDNEAPETAALRELEEETGCVVEADDLVALGDVTLRSGKRVYAFAAEAECDPEAHASNTFEIEWPPPSGQGREFPEIDRIEWVTPKTAAVKLNPALVTLIARLQTTISSD
jgi:predicted NUDIX family NTP pyrophosphohydrolase